ncbi:MULTISPECIES: beta strand repeat-containing protein, partial [Deefgea]|uniref:beta strand repeat-containing protein n=1 Tax=Deefgea TaxID=400947 RepID=UPI0019445094
GNLTVTADAAGSSITTGSGTDSVTLGAGLDSVNTGSGNDTIYSALAALDTIAGGDGTDVLVLTSSGAATLSAATVSMSGIETLKFANDTTLTISAAYFSALTHFDGTGKTVDITVSGASGSIDLSSKSFTNINSVTFAGADGQQVTIDSSGLPGVTTLDGGDGFDSIVFSSGSSLSVPSNLINFEKVDASLITGDVSIVGSASTQEIATGSGDDTINSAAATGNTTLSGGAGADSITGGAQNDQIDLGVDTDADVVNAGAGSDTVLNLGSQDTANLGAGNDRITYVAGATVDGGDDLDTLAVTAAAGSLTLTMGAGVNIAGYQNFENLDASSSDDALTVSYGNTSTSIKTGSGNDTITYNKGASTVVVDAGDGLDTLVIGAGSNSVPFVQMEFGSDTDQIAGAGTYTGFENLDSTAYTGSITFSAGSGTTSVLTGSGNDLIDASAADQAVAINAGNGNNNIQGSRFGDTITLGLGADTIAAGDGADTIVGTLTANDTVNFGAGADSYTYQDVANTTVDGGTGSDTLHLISGMGATSIDLTQVDADQVSGNSDIRNFENLDGSAADDDLTITVNAAGNVSGGSGNDVLNVDADVNFTGKTLSGIETLNLNS